MKQLVSPILFASLLVFALSSCSNDKPEGNGSDSIQDTIGNNTELSDSTRLKFRRMVNALPVPFEILNQFSGAHLPYKADLTNQPENAGSYSDASSQAVNLGIYGADLTYMISQDKIAESGAYLKSVRRLSDAVVVPSAFDEAALNKFEVHKEKKDSLQVLMNRSYQRIDSTLIGNERLTLATLVIYGGWIESIYLTTQHLGNEKQNEKNKVLFDMLALEQPQIDNIAGLLACFPEDSTCAWLYRETQELKTVFPTGNLSPDQFSDQLQQLRDKATAIRNKLVRVS